MALWYSQVSVMSTKRGKAQCMPVAYPLLLVESSTFPFLEYARLSRTRRSIAFFSSSHPSRFTLASLLLCSNSMETLGVTVVPSQLERFVGVRTSQGRLFNFANVSFRLSVASCEEGCISRLEKTHPLLPRSTAHASSVIHHSSRQRRWDGMQH